MSAVISATGALGKDVDLRHAGQSVVANFTLATSAYDGKTKEYQTKWFNVELWGKQAEWASTKLRKGSKVWVTGEYINSFYEKEGQKREASYVKASVIELIKDPKSDSQPSQDFNSEVPF